jgi:hypothetical protein
MDTLEAYRQIIETTLAEYASVPYAYGDIQTEVVFDRANDHYLLVNVGWRDDRRIHSSLIHIDIINGKVWIQRDGTEHGIANDLVRAGIPKDQIILGFRPPEVRPYTEYAVA